MCHQSKKSMLISLLLPSLLFLFIHPDFVNSHGRLIEPPSRSTMWRYGFNTPPNYNDHELYCGGFSRMWRTNGGKCGICGDPWDMPTPRPNEAGGMYGRGVIARKYQKEQIIKVRIELTANHFGYFQFRICPNNEKKVPATQACLDQYVLRNAITDDDKYYPGPGTKVFEMQYQLPKGLTCSQCVFQWRYVAGNSWGVCKNGTGAVGCGPQEEFRACADVTITEGDGTADNTPNIFKDTDVYIPEIDSNGIDNNEKGILNDLDYTGDKNYENALEAEVKFESVIIIALCSILAVALFFAFLFFYYLRGRPYLEKYAAEKDWDMPSLPSLHNMKRPKMPTMNMPKITPVNWPLSTVQIKKLPQFLKSANKSSSSQSETLRKKSATTTVSAPINILSTTNEAATGPATGIPPPVLKRPLQQEKTAPLKAGPKAVSNPRPPPRNKKPPPPAIPEVRASSPKAFATIAPRSHNMSRPNAPPPVVPPNVLEIDSTPRDVTINGVTVGGSNKQKRVIPSHNDVSVVESRKGGGGGFIVPARPVMADENMPDSLDNHQNRPPPLPSCPPPQFEDVQLTEEDPRSTSRSSSSATDSTYSSEA